MRQAPGSNATSTNRGRFRRHPPLRRTPNQFISRHRRNASRRGEASPKDYWGNVQVLQISSLEMSSTSSAGTPGRPAREPPSSGGTRARIPRGPAPPRVLPFGGRRPHSMIWKAPGSPKGFPPPLHKTPGSGKWSPSRLASGPALCGMPVSHGRSLERRGGTSLLRRAASRASWTEVLGLARSRNREAHSGRDGRHAHPPKRPG